MSRLLRRYCSQLYLFSLFLLVPLVVFGAQRQGPNIVFVFSDDHRADLMGVAGDPYIETPRLDRLASEGARFTNAFTVAGTCSPSRGAFWTGRYIHSAGTPNITHQNNTFLKLRTTFPMLLQDAGYHTAYFGKWHLGKDDQPQLGYDHWVGKPFGRPDRPGFDQTFIINGEAHPTKGFSDDELTKLAANYIKEQVPGDQPFFMVIGLRSPHLPFAYPERLSETLADIDIPKPESYFEDFAVSGRDPMMKKSQIRIENNGLFKGRFKTWDNFIKSHYRSAQSIDDSVGRMLDALEEAGIAEDTVFVYSSDHGYSLGDHGFMEKHFAFEEVMRIPFMIRWPGRVPAGIEPDQLVQSIDLAPTLLRWAGVEIPEGMQGLDLTPLVNPREEIESWRDAVFFVCESRSGLIPGQVAVRTTDGKLVKYESLKTIELYDLKKDPKESRSVYKDPEYAELRETMLAKFDEVVEEIGYRPRPQRKWMDRVFAIHGVTEEKAKALSEYYQENSFELENGPVDWKTIFSNEKGKFRPDQFAEAGDGMSLLAIPIDLLVKEDPHVAIWVGPWPYTQMYWKGENIWKFDPGRKIAGNLANPPLNLSNNVVLLSIKDIKKPFEIYVESMKDSIELPGIELKR